MANRVNQWLLRRVLYLLSVYFVLASAPQPTLLTTILYELNYFMIQFELPFSWSIFLTTAEIVLIVLVSLLITVLGVYLGFRKTIQMGSTLGRRLRVNRKVNTGERSSGVSGRGH